MGLLNKINGLFLFIPDWLGSLLMRIAIAVPFWRSARTKADRWDFWNVNEDTVYLFEYEYALPLIGPKTAATLASMGEHVLPVLVVLGLMTRLSTTGLFAMTLVIQFWVYPHAWPDHILWFGLLMGIMVYGPGAISLDRVLGNEKNPAPSK